jgi:hypothetical protein
MNKAYEQINVGRLKMKKILARVMVLVVGIMFISPTMGYSNPFDRDSGYARHGAVNNYRYYDRQPYHSPAPVRYERSRGDNDGLLIAGIALGGIALGAVLGSVISQPRVVNTKEVVYNDARTVYNEDTPPGQWVTVNGQWVPAHKVWVPVNP